MHEPIPELDDTELWAIRQALSSVRDQYGAQHNEYTDVANA